MNRKFSDLTKDFSPERRARIEARKAELREEMDLAELRRALALTQANLAETMEVQQGEISKIEKRTDLLLSTLRRFLQAMGADLEIRAVFDGRSVKIGNLSSLRETAPEAEPRSRSG
jgi:transcriptional regulator with XRE-family HTH domain